MSQRDLPSPARTHHRRDTTRRHFLLIPPPTAMGTLWCLTGRMLECSAWGMLYMFVWWFVRWFVPRESVCKYRQLKTAVRCALVSWMSLSFLLNDTKKITKNGLWWGCRCSASGVVEH